MDRKSPEGSVQGGYHIGNVGTGSRVAQGEHITWIEGLSTQQGGDALSGAILSLLAQLATDEVLNEDDRALATQKTEAVATALANASESPEVLRRTLRDAKTFLTSCSTWAWHELQTVLSSAPAQQAIGTITEATVRGTIRALINAP